MIKNKVPLDEFIQHSLYDKNKGYYGNIVAAPVFKDKRKDCHAAKLCTELEYM